MAYLNQTKKSLSLIILSLLLAAPVLAEKVERDIAEYHQIIDRIDNATMPEKVKQQLLKDLRVDLMETIKRSRVPEHIKKQLVKDIRQIQH